MRAIRLPALLAVACLACGGGTARPGIPGQPMGRSANPRAGEITFELGPLSREGTAVAVDLEFVNGVSRDFRSVSTRVTLHGVGGERRELELPLGMLRQGARKRLRARFPDVAFPVHDVTVELLYALP